MSDDYMAPIDVLTPDYIEIPTGEPEFDTIRIRLSMSRHGNGTNYQRVYPMSWIRVAVQTSEQLLAFIHTETEEILRYVCAHIDADLDLSYTIDTLYFATGGDPVAGSWEPMRPLGAVHWIGRVPLPN